MSTYDYLNNRFTPTQGEKLWSDFEQNSTIYKEVLPCRELQPYVACYWVSKVIAIPNEVVTNRIIPDGCMDIVFNINDLAEGKGGNVVGIMLSPEENVVNELREFIGVRFWPGGIIPFIKNTAKDFTNSLVPLEYIWGKEAAILCDAIYINTSLYDRISILDMILKKKLQEFSSIDPMIKNMLYNVYKNKGNISIKDLSRELNISQRHLSRKANQWIGSSPKSFNSIVRFQSVINSLNTKPNSNIIKLALNNGYYDQAHFIKEFKALYGKTPGQLLIHK